ncbi:MAG: trigger factor [Patescibacteria group bacterium]
MNVSVIKKPKSLVSLTVEVPWDEVQPYLARAGRAWNEEHAVPGFRKGQAPLDIIEKRLGKEALFDIAIDALVHHTYLKAVAERHLETIGQPQLIFHTKELDKPVRYEAVVALMPDVTLAPLQNISVTKNTIRVDDHEVEKLLEEIRRLRAHDRVVDEPVTLGHKVTFHYHLRQDHVDVGGSMGADTDIVLGETPVLPGFSEALLGMKAGEEKQFSTRFPDSWSRKDLAGRTVEVTLKVVRVAHLDLPPLNDGFAVMLGNFKNMTELREKMKENLQLEKEDEEERRVGGAAVDALVKMSAFSEIPDILIESEAARMRGEIAHEVRQHGVTVEEWLKKLGKTEEGLAKELQPQAGARVKATLAMRALAKEQDIMPEEKELAEEVEHVLRHAGSDPVVVERIHSPAFREYLQNQIVARKTIEWLKIKVVH